MSRPDGPAPGAEACPEARGGWAASERGPGAEVCPGADTLGALAAGAPLAGAEREALVAHLGRCSACAGLLPDLLEPDAAEGREPLSRGDRIGRYLIVDPLGEGAMGVVYAAYDPALHRQVALKLLRARWSGSGEATARLLREGWAMARLRHPNIAQIHDLGVEAGRVYLVMDLLTGGDLRRWIRPGGRPAAEVLAALLPIAAALGAMHRAGLLHRDVKPENILRVGSRLVLSDFGLAQLGRELVASPDEQAIVGPLTGSGRVLGTPVYMAPEQLAGAPASAASDQFSFCVTAFEALTGERPFPCSAATLAGLREALGRQEVRPAPAVPAPVLHALLRGLRHDPAARYPSMEALAAALAAALARPRSPLLRAGAALGLGALALGLLWRAAQGLPAVCGPLSPPLIDAARGTPAAALPAARAYVAAWTGVAEASCRATFQGRVQSQAVWRGRQRCLLRGAAALEALLLDPRAAEALGAASPLPPPSRCGMAEALRDAEGPEPIEAARRRVAVLWVRAALGHPVAEEAAALVAQGRAARPVAQGGGAALLREALLLQGAARLSAAPAGAEAPLREALALAVAADAQEDVVRGYAYLARAVAVADPAEAEGLRALARAAGDRAGVPVPAEGDLGPRRAALSDRGRGGPPLSGARAIPGPAPDATPAPPPDR